MARPNKLNIENCKAFTVRLNNEQLKTLLKLGKADTPQNAIRNLTRKEGVK